MGCGGSKSSAKGKDDDDVLFDDITLDSVQSEENGNVNGENPEGARLSTIMSIQASFRKPPLASVSTAPNTKDEDDTKAKIPPTTPLTARKSRKSVDELGDFAREGEYLLTQRQRYLVVKMIGKGSEGVAKLCLDMFDNQKPVVTKIIQKTQFNSFPKDEEAYDTNIQSIKKMANKDLLKELQRTLPTTTPRRGPTPTSGNGSRSPFDAAAAEEEVAPVGTAWEIAVLKKLRHPNLLQLYEVINDVGSHYVALVLEYLPGGSLGDYVKKSAPRGLPEEECRGYFRDVARGLQYLHFQHVVHRDIKLDNLLLTDDARVKICDFGRAHVSDPSQHDDFDLSSEAGTPAFMAPELFTPEVWPFDGRAADIWAMGVCLFVMLFGTFPFQFKSRADAREQLTSPGPVSLPPRARSLSPHLQDLLLSLLEKDPSKRATIAQVLTNPWVTSLGAHPITVYIDNYSSLEVSPIWVSNVEALTAMTMTGGGESLEESFNFEDLPIKEFKPGEYITRQGEDADAAFFINRGEVVFQVQVDEEVEDTQAATGLVGTSSLGNLGSSEGLFSLGNLSLTPPTSPTTSPAISPSTSPAEVKFSPGDVKSFPTQGPSSPGAAGQDGPSFLGSALSLESLAGDSLSGSRPSKSSRSRRLARYIDSAGAGEFVGTVDVVGGSGSGKRTASIVAKEATEVVVMGAAHLRSALHKVAGLEDRIRKRACQSLEVRGRMVTMLRQNLQVGAALGAEEGEGHLFLDSALEERKFLAGEHVCNEGDEANEVYFLVEGTATIMVPTTVAAAGLDVSAMVPEHSALARYEKGSFVGLIAAVQGKPRREVGVVADTNITVWVLKAREIKALMARQPAIAKVFKAAAQERMAQKMRILEEVEAMVAGCFVENVRVGLEKRFKISIPAELFSGGGAFRPRERTCPAGFVLAYEGAPAKDCYYIVQGVGELVVGLKAAAEAQSAPGSQPASRVREATEGDIIGMTDIVLNEKVRQTSVRAKTDMVLLCMSAQEFKGVLGRVPDLAAVMQRTAEERAAAWRGAASRATASMDVARRGT